MKKKTKILFFLAIVILLLGIFVLVFVARQESILFNQTEFDKKDKFKQAIDQLDSSEKLVDFLNQSFVFELKQGDIALEPKEFFEKKKGNELDFAVFIAHVLDFHKYETGIIRYEFTVNNQKSVNTVVNFSDTDLPKYIFFSQGKTFLTHHGWSFNELFQAEEKRLNIKISRFVIFYPNVFDLLPKKWIER